MNNFKLGFFKTEEKESQDIFSCFWNARKSAYTVSAEGPKVATILMTRDEAFALNNGDKSILKKYDELKDLTDVTVHIVCDGYYWNNAEANVIKVDVHNNKRVNECPYGVFTLTEVSHEYCLVPYKTEENKQTLIKNKSLKEDIIEFFNNPKEGRKNKKGMLLYGAPGNGKTTEIMSLFPLAEEFKLRIIILDSKVNLNYISGWKEVLGAERTIFILEEITERIYGREIEHLLTFLDGENSWNNSVTIATTNYPENMPANLVDRPGRFETFIEYCNPTRQEIVELANQFGFTDEVEISALIGQGFSFDYVSFILATAKNKNTLIKETIDNERSKRKRLSETFKGKIGI